MFNSAYVTSLLRHCSRPMREGERIWPFHLKDIDLKKPDFLSIRDWFLSLTKNIPGVHLEEKLGSLCVDERLDLALFCQSSWRNNRMTKFSMHSVSYGTGLLALENSPELSPNWSRIDFDPLGAPGDLFTHPLIHLHLNGQEVPRIPVTELDEKALVDAVEFILINYKYDDLYRPWLNSIWDDTRLNDQFDFDTFCSCVARGTNALPNISMPAIINIFKEFVRKEKSVFIPDANSISEGYEHLVYPV